MSINSKWAGNVHPRSSTTNHMTVLTNFRGGEEDCVKTSDKRPAHTATNEPQCSSLCGCKSAILPVRTRQFRFCVKYTASFRGKHSSKEADRHPDRQSQKQGQLSHYFMICRTLWARSPISPTLPQSCHVTEWHIISLAFSQSKVWTWSFLCKIKRFTPPSSLLNLALYFHFTLLFLFLVIH